MKTTIGNDIHALQLKKLTFRSQAMQNNENDNLTATQMQKCHCRIMQYYASSTSTIYNDIYALQLRKWTFRARAIQNTANGTLSATQVKTGLMFW